jgi:hypothetical protein
MGRGGRAGELGWARRADEAPGRRFPRGWVATGPAQPSDRRTGRRTAGDQETLTGALASGTAGPRTIPGPRTTPFPRTIRCPRATLVPRATSATETASGSEATTHAPGQAIRALATTAHASERATHAPGG